MFNILISENDLHERHLVFSKTTSPYQKHDLTYISYTWTALSPEKWSGCPTILSFRDWAYVQGRLLLSFQGNSISSRFFYFDIPKGFNFHPEIFDSIWINFLSWQIPIFRHFDTSKIQWQKNVEAKECVASGALRKQLDWSMHVALKWLGVLGIRWDGGIGDSCKCQKLIPDTWNSWNKHFFNGVSWFP